MKIYKTTQGILIEDVNEYYLVGEDWDSFVNVDSLVSQVNTALQNTRRISNGPAIIENGLLPPIGHQEIWAAGVTYLSSKSARIAESKEAGGEDFYDRVYDAKRPELFFKSASYRAVGSGQNVRIRKDASWNVPEPELTLLINSSGKIIGYTIGNDMSSRDIEGENPLYLPQAKCFDGAAAIGPCIYVSESPLPSDTQISMDIRRSGTTIFSGTTSIDQIKRKFADLVSYLYREMTFPQGCFLMTGTGIVPPNDFTLEHGDEIRIAIDSIGTLVNNVS